MSTFRRKEMLLLAFVPLAAIWVYALRQSFGQVDSMMSAMPVPAAATRVAGSDPGIDDRVRSPASPAGASPAEPAEAMLADDAGLPFASVNAAANAKAAANANVSQGADASAGADANAGADVTASADVDANATAASAGAFAVAGDADLALDEDPRQRFFDPYEYALALEAHYENQQPLNLSPSAIEAATVGPDAAAAAAAAAGFGNASGSIGAAGATSGAADVTRATGADSRQPRDPRLRHARDD